MAKLRLSITLLRLSLVIVGMVIPTIALCDAPSGEFHLLAGLVSGKFSGLGDNANGTFSVPNSIDVEYELITSRHLSFFARATLAYQISTGILPYAYTGIGARVYVWSNSRGYDQIQNGFEIRKRPNFRLYVGPDLGFSQAVIKQYTAVIQTTSAFLEVGANAGLIYQMSSTIGLEAQVSYSFGFGISTIAVGASIFRGLAGLSFYY